MVDAAAPRVAVRVNHTQIQVDRKQSMDFIQVTVTGVDIAAADLGCVGNGGQQLARCLRHLLLIGSRKRSCGPQVARGPLYL